jgi:DICT domain-containing protein
LTVLAIFGKLTHPGFNPLDIIGREAMRESPFYDQIQNEVRQANIIEALEIRFGKIPAREFKKDIFAMEDTEALSELLRVAIKVRTLSAFRKALAQKLKSASAT